MPIYLLGKTYKRVNNIDDMIYVRSTTRLLCERWNKHKRKSKKSTSQMSKLITLYGQEHFKIVLIRNTL